MMELRRRLGALSLAGALLVAVPAVASAAHRPMDGIGGTPNAASQRDAGHSERVFGEHGGRGVRFGALDNDPSLPVMPMTAATTAVPNHEFATFDLERTSVAKDEHG